MESIIIETEQTIALKKKQVQEKQSEVNEMAFEMSNRVKWIYELNNQIECLDRDLHQLKKNIEFQKMNKPSQLINTDQCLVSSKQINRD